MCAVLARGIRLKTLLADAKLKRGDAKDPLPDDSVRPKVRQTCLSMPRPCPFVGCRHHLFLEVTRAGSITFPWGDDVAALQHMPDTCSLDVAERGTLPLEDVGKALHLSRERTRTVEHNGMRNLAKKKGVKDYGPEAT